MNQIAARPDPARGTPDRTDPSPRLLSIGVVIVSYHSASHLEECIRALADERVEIVVADNGSKDESADVARRSGANVLEIGTNMGYAFACNRGVEAMARKHDWLAFVNPDVRLCGTELLRAASEAPAQVTAFSPLMLDEEGRPHRDIARPEPTLGRTVRLYLLSWAGEFSARRHYGRLRRFKGRYFETDATSGGSLVIRSSTFEELGGWSQHFFLDMEDVDLCRRVRRAGGKLVVDCEVVGLHQKLTSSAEGHSDIRELEGPRSEIVYYLKNHRRWEAYVVAAAVLTGTTARRVIRALASGRGLGLATVVRRQGELARAIMATLRMRTELDPPLPGRTSS